MANRIVGNVIIVDSAMGNAYLMHGSGGPVSRDFYANAIAIKLIDNTSAFELSIGADTTNIVVAMGVSSNLVHFSNPQRLNDVKVPLCTATTGFIYLA